MHKSLKQHKPTQNPSFSSTLLDQIYRSMDPNHKKSCQFNLPKGKLTTAADEAPLRRASLVEKWMETKAPTCGRKPPLVPEFDRSDNDPSFFSSGSSSSDSSFGWFSEPEGLTKSRSIKPSCFGPFTRGKPVKTNVQVELEDDHGALIKSKARALKIYASLKKVKQPVSPGGRLTSFLNSIFANGHAKKSSKDLSSEDNKIERRSKSTCSSASSFSRSCLSKNSPRSREKRSNGTRRTVRFYPGSVIVDQDLRPCGEKFIPDGRDFSMACLKKKSDEDDEDVGSDSSSDLFELDHLSVLENDGYDELPVFETTHFGTSRAIVC